MSGGNWRAYPEEAIKCLRWIARPGGKKSHIKREEQSKYGQIKGRNIRQPFEMRLIWDRWGINGVEKGNSKQKQLKEWGYQGWKENFLKKCQPVPVDWHGKDFSVLSPGEPGKAFKVIKSLDAELAKASLSCKSKHGAEGGTIASKCAGFWNQPSTLIVGRYQGCRIIATYIGTN